MGCFRLHRGRLIECSSSDEADDLAATELALDVLAIIRETPLPAGLRRDYVTRRAKPEYL